MAVRAVALEDVPWAVARLSERRSQLRSFAPVFWRPSRDAAERHREYLIHLLSDSGAVAYRTDTELILAHSGRDGWVIDDAAVHDDAWARDGEELWGALTATITGNIRFVCPVPEAAQRCFAHSKGFRTVESWWYWDVPDAESIGSESDPIVPGAAATLVSAPPVYDPGGPILFVSEIHDGDLALTGAKEVAKVVGSPVVVVRQSAGDLGLAAPLVEAGFARHCDFLEGNIGESIRRHR